MATTQTIAYNNFTTIVSLGERTIYLKFIDQINFVNFEGNVDSKELRLQFELADIYRLICDALNEEGENTVSTSINNGFMKLSFQCLVGGFLKINFEAILKEKMLSNDGQLTINFNKMEQKHESLMKKLELLERKMTKQQEENDVLMNAISNAMISLIIGGHPQNSNMETHKFYNINTTTLDITITNGIQSDLENIKYLYKLEKLKITGHYQTPLNDIENKTVKELKIYSSTNDSKRFKKYFTNLTQKFPSLETLEVDGYAFASNESVVKLLAFTPKKDKIKIINFINVTGYNVSELQNYCQVNKIMLNIS
jgi:hypothetical protein